MPRPHGARPGVGASSPKVQQVQENARSPREVTIITREVSNTDTTELLSPPIFDHSLLYHNNIDSEDHARTPFTTSIRPQSPPATSPATLPADSPPPSSPSSLPSPSPGAPVPTAYCIPFSEGGGSGCLAVVTNAAPDAHLLFRLRSSAAGKATVTLTVQEDKTYAYARFYLPFPTERQLRLTGTVEYLNQPGQVWSVLTEYPQTQPGKCTKDLVPAEGHRWLRCAATLTMPDGNELTLTYVVVDPDIQPPPPPPPPPPPAPPVQAIKAYCIPSWVGSGAGCYAKVASAAPGSRIRFRLTSTEGVSGVTDVQLKPDSTWGGAFYALPIPSVRHTNFTGTVEYVDVPGPKWSVATWDPRAEQVRWNIRELDNGLCEYLYDLKVPIDPDGKQVVRMSYYPQRKCLPLAWLHKFFHDHSIFD